MLLLNRGAAPAPIAVTWKEFNLFPGGDATVRDLWKRADVGTVTGRYETKVEPHGVVMVKVTPQF